MYILKDDLYSLIGLEKEKATISVSISIHLGGNLSIGAGRGPWKYET